MKKIWLIVLILTLFCSNPIAPVFSAENDMQDDDVQSESSDIQETSQEEMFAPVDLDLTDYTHMNKENKKFNLSVEKEDKPTYVKNSGTVWDEDKLFRYTYYSDESNLRVLPSYGSLNSYITRDLDENTTVMVGQDGISAVGGTSLNFFSMNGSYYAQGARLDSSTKNLNYTVGAFDETNNNNQELAAAISTKPVHILKSKGTFSFGGGMFGNVRSNETKTTSGIFTTYNRGKFSLSAQYSESSYSFDTGSSTNMIHIMPQYVVNPHLTLKSKIVKDMDVDEMQGELGISIKPLKDTDVLSIDLTATNYQSQNVTTRQRVKFSTSFRF